MGNRDEILFREYNPERRSSRQWDEVEKLGEPTERCKTEMATERATSCSILQDFLMGHMKCISGPSLGEGINKEVIIHHLVSYLPKVHPVRLELPALLSCACEPRSSSQRVLPPKHHPTTHPTTIVSVQKPCDRKLVVDGKAWSEVLSGSIWVKLVISWTELVPQQWLA